MPIREFETSTSLDHNGTDLYSTEMLYCVTADELDWRLAQNNAMLARFRKPSITKAQLAPGVMPPGHRRTLAPRMLDDPRV
ncbi:hypothetical protein AB6809_35875 [Paraburkholderia sp. RCC_158]|uniref:hypothetical protein n=1 Tax=Paraburkholderia sp. RCC_158 TaxID=3239220 RepID=UPI003526B035